MELFTLGEPEMLSAGSSLPATFCWCSDQQFEGADIITIH
jgi:hypothetical protein